MATRLDFSALGPGTQLVPVVLVAGVPVVLTPAGVHPTTTAASSGTLDGAWWPGTGTLTETLPTAATLDPVKEWLDPGQEFVVETTSRLLEGDCEQKALSFDLYDPDGAATALLSGREGYTQQLLGAAIASGAGTITLQYGGGFPNGGWASVGRESFTYQSIAGAVLTIGTGTRGAFGSRDVAHARSARHPPVVTASGVRSWHGRRLSFWLASLSADGLTLTDPTLLFLGVVGKGIQLVGDLTRWRIPADGIVEALSQKLPTRTVTLYGVAHHDGTAGTPDSALDRNVQSDTPDYSNTPLSVGWAADVEFKGRTALVGADADYHNKGWHPSWESFLADWNARAEAYYQTEFATSQQHYARLGPDGRMTARGYTVGATSCLLQVYWAWCDGQQRAFEGSTTEAWLEITSPRAVPEAWVPLDGRIHIPDDADWDAMPTALESGSGGTVCRWALTAKVGDESITTTLSDRDGTNHTVVGHIPDLWRAVFAGAGVCPAVRERTTCTLSARVEALSWYAGLQQLCTMYDALGGDHHSDSVDWTDIEAVVLRNATPGLPSERAFTVQPGGDSLLDMIVRECRLAGLALCMRRGRLSVYRPGDTAASESTSRSVAATDLCSASALSVQDTSEGLASSVLFELADGTPVSWIDETHRDESGDGAEIKLLVHDGIAQTDTAALMDSLRASAWAILGPVSEPWRELTLALPLPFLDLAPGDLLSVTHAQVPTWSGTRGLTAAVCQVTSVSLRLCGGVARAVVKARLATGVPRGYAPAGLVAAGGLAALSTDVTLDTLSAWGTDGVAYDGEANGGAGTFTAGDKVVLTEVGVAARSTADEPFTVSSVAGAVVTLDGQPSAAMIALAAAQYKVALRFDDWNTVTASQKARAAFVANDSDGFLGAADSPHRWSP